MAATRFRDVVVCRTLISVDSCIGLGVALNLGLDSRLLGVIADCEADLSRLTTNYTQDRWVPAYAKCLFTTAKIERPIHAGLQDHFTSKVLGKLSQA